MIRKPLLLPLILTAAPLMQIHAEKDASLDRTMHPSAQAVETFRNYGIPAGISTHRTSIVVDGKDGKPRFLINLNDWTGGYGILLIEPKTGKSSFFPYPFKTDGSSFASLYSSDGIYYNQFGNNFCAFDPKLEAFTYSTTTRDSMAMMFTEDEHGVIWMATYPKAHLMSYNPSTKKFQEHGAINTETWPQYPRSLAVDDEGWVYAGISFTKAQIIAYNPATKERKVIAPEEERVLGSFDIRSPFHSRAKTGTVWRAKDGYVYARMPNSPDRPWFKLRGGEFTRVESVSGVEPRIEVAGTQFLVQGKLPDGSEITNLDVPAKTYTLREADGTTREITFDYPSSGARVTSLTLGPDRRVYGSTGHPLQFFALDPSTAKFDLAPNPEGGHINAVTSMGKSVFGAIYTQGVLIEHDTSSGDPTPQMKRLTQAGETVLRPFDLRGLSNGKEIVMVGSPGYGRTGGGMLFYNIESKQTDILEHESVIPHQSTKALVELPNGNLVGATTIEAGTGGQPIAKDAELYIMKMPERKVIFRDVMIPGTPQYRDLIVGKNGLVYGLAGTHGRKPSADFYLGGDPIFFVFDPEKQKIIHQENLLSSYGKLTGSQAPRVMTFGPDGQIYILFAKCIAKIDPETFAHTKIADTPVPIHSGVALLDDLLIFSSGGEIWSYRLKL